MIRTWTVDSSQPPDGITEAAAPFASEGYELTFEEVLREPLLSFRGAERRDNSVEGPMRSMKPPCRAMAAIPGCS